MIYSVFNEKKAAAALCAALLILLPGCGTKEAAAPSGSSPASVQSAASAEVTLSSGVWSCDTEDLTAVLTGEDVGKLYLFPNLKTVDAVGSSCTDDLVIWAMAHPDVSVRFTVETPSGSLASDITALDLHDLTHEQTSAWAAVLPIFRSLQSVDLGSEAEGRSLTFEDIRQLEAAAPDAVFSYAFTAFDRQLNTSDTELNLSHVTMDDNGARVREILPIMNQLQTLDMDTCGVDDEHMAAIRDDYPNVEVIWRVWFGDDYSVRTNTEKILASKPSAGGNLTVENSESLKYCTSVRYLDVGHNQILQDISFLRYMPDLEVCIIAMVYFDDLSPISGCTKLEYLETQSNGEGLTDLSPLSGLINLEHLNIGNLPGVTDITPLYGLTNLKRLWITASTPVPEEQVSEMQSRVPDCEINTTSPDPTEEGWRFIGSYKDDDEVPHWVKCERYFELCEQFGYETLTGGYSLSRNDPYYDGTPSEEELAAAAAQEEIYRQNRLELHNEGKAILGIP